MTGSPSPQFERAVEMFQRGQVAEAARLLTLLAEDGDGLALETLGEMHWAGILRQDPARARTYFERADAAQHVPASLRVTNLMASGIAGVRDWSAALGRLRKEGESDPARRRAWDLIVAMAVDADGDPPEAPKGRRLSISPDVMQFDKLFTANECRYLLTLEAGGFAPATVLNAQRQPVRDPIRTSDQITVNWLIEDPAVHALNRRLAAATGTAPDRGEAMQILRYQPGQQYRAHYDYQPGAANQRVCTVLVYLNDGYDGGETAFLKTGLSVRGRQGDAIVFANVTPDGRRDDMAEHAGLPVARGTKFLLSRWIRETRWAP